AGAHSPELPPSTLFATVTRALELTVPDGRLVDPSALRRVVDLPVELDDLEAEDRRLVERFLRWARGLGAHRGYVARSRAAWGGGGGGGGGPSPPRPAPPPTPARAPPGPPPHPPPPPPHQHRARPLPAGAAERGRAGGPDPLPGDAGQCQGRADLRRGPDEVRA